MNHGLLAALREQDAQAGDLFEAHLDGTEFGAIHRADDVDQFSYCWSEYDRTGFIENARWVGRVCVAVIHADGAYLLSVEPSFIWEVAR